MRYYDTDEALRFTAARRAAVDYFVRTRVIVPAREASRRGASRGYSFRNLAEIAVAAELLDAGIEITTIAEALRSLRDSWSQVASQRDTILAIWRLPADHLTGKGRSLTSLIGPVDEILPLITAGYSLHAGIPVGWIVSQLEKATGERLD